MTEAEKEIIRLLGQILQKLPDSPKLKYETKVEFPTYQVIEESKLNPYKKKNNEKAETED